MPKAVRAWGTSAPREGMRKYGAFRGVDYASDETKIDLSRSPRAVNVIADEGGFPERRFGWRTVHRFAGCISGFFPFENDKDETRETFIVHAGDKLIRIKLDAAWTPVAGSETVLLTGLAAGRRSSGFYMNGKLYILTGREYIVYDGTAAALVGDETAYAPLTSYQRQPTGGGQEQERVNMLCKYRKNRFVGDGTSATYQLDVNGIDPDYTPVASYFITGESIPVASFDAARGTVTFASPPRAPAAAGTSNVEIKFAKTTGDRAKILGCTIFSIYGVENTGNRVFVSGNAAHAATEWYSGLNDPTYFPDLNFSVVGSSDFPIMCYLKAQGELLIIKADNRQEGTIWHHEGTTVNGAAAFPLKEGVPGYGCVARYAAASLNDDPLYLSPRGVYAPATTYALSYVQRQLFCRSRRINPKLNKERGIENAVAAVWRGWYVLCVNGHAYVADGNQDRAEQGYEWYYWDNIPAYQLRSHKQTLFFGTEDGRLCKFNDDYISRGGETLMRAYNDDGAAIHAEWCTKLDDMDMMSKLKIMPKRGSAIHLKAYTRSKIEVWIRTESDFGRLCRELYADRLTFEDINFERFTFSTAVNTMIPLLTKKKKWKAIQILLISDAVNEGFGVYEIDIRFFYGNFAKR
ncbi:MAG: hypothetical protein MR935_07400 [Agathobaculum sp.]|uniref:hypothetical protein n=1 Tax=Agathobaculum sp. TaxID=2048138 RepID=UPI0025C47FA3|nr:hypothetical protein [Agathobaculum sp.]MCI7126000.1 hypothetical protein [Agathobaculum sp.]